jgi:hypothetical protein
MSASENSPWRYVSAVTMTRTMTLTDHCPTCRSRLVGRKRQSLRHGPNVWSLERRWCPNKCAGVDALVLDAGPRALTLLPRTR